MKLWANVRPGGDFWAQKSHVPTNGLGNSAHRPPHECQLLLLNSSFSIVNPLCKWHTHFIPVKSPWNIINIHFLITPSLLGLTARIPFVHLFFPLNCPLSNGYLMISPLYPHDMGQKPGSLWSTISSLRRTILGFTPSSDTPSYQLSEYYDYIYI